MSLSESNSLMRDSSQAAAGVANATSVTNATSATRVTMPNNVAAWPFSALLKMAVPALVVSLVFIVVIGQYTDIDLWIADYYFDSARKIFPWDRTWFGRDLMHGYLKNVIVWSGFSLMGLALLDAALQLKKINLFGLSGLRRAQFRVLTLFAFAEPLLIRTLKGSSNMHCPWGVERYGGEAYFLRMLDWVPEGWRAGGCFPAGHASAGMWLMAIAVFWLPHSPRKALWAFCAGSSVGLIMGWVQQMRGQHFLTHTLWTFWLSAFLFVCLLSVFSKYLFTADASAGQSSEAPRWMGKWIPAWIRA